MVVLHGWSHEPLLLVDMTNPIYLLRQALTLWPALVCTQAVDKAMDFLSLFMNVAGGLSVSSVLEMLASLVLTVRVVTVPIIMR